MKYFFSIVALLFYAVSASAQFYTTGDDPGSLKWSRIRTGHYDVIYPCGLDSLAGEYALNLEKYRLDVSRSAGYAPGEYTRTRMPVILHAYNAQSNGVVVWAPKRMELFTTPQAYSPEPMPWIQNLAIHESRHVAQMQQGMSHVFRPFNYIFGQMWTGAIAGLYPSKWLLEGDAVVAETALTKSGRGRTADLLNWYMAAFDNGDFRKSKKWKYGSYRYYTPNEYSLGYFYISGIRYLYDCPDFTSRYLHYAARRPYNLFFERTVTRSISGKNVRNTFNEIITFYSGLWERERELRRPFIPSERLSDRKIRRYTEYEGNESAPEGIFSIKSSLVSSRALVLHESSGKERRITAFAGETSRLEYSDSTRRLYWSETVPGARWGQKSNSKIRYYDLEEKRKRSLTRRGKLFNPAVSDSLGLVCATEYPAEGGSRIAVFRHTGERVLEIDAPDSLQVVEPAWIGDRIFFCGISGCGSGLYCTGPVGSAEAGHVSMVLAPQPVKINGLKSEGNRLMFTSDRNGVNEMYTYSPASGKLVQVTSTPYGATDFQYSQDGKTLYYSAYTHDGKILSRTDADSLINRQEDFSDIHIYTVAEKLSEQERELGASAEEGPDGTLLDAETEIQKPSKYRKFPHLFNIHSWAPVYFSYDNIKNLSYDYYYDMVSLGTAAVMQNHLGTFTANFGYSAHKDPYDRDFWRHSGHAKFTYTGLYPVIEASVDFNDRAARSSFLNMSMVDDTHYMVSLMSQSSRVPSLSGTVRTYIPFNFSSGGWYRGFIPQLSWSASNDVVIGKINQSLTGSVRAYTMLASATSEIYPDWGIGVEAGVSGYIGQSDWFSPVAYGYVYGYLPGFFGSHGFRLTATGQIQTRTGSLFSTSAVNNLPRGLSSSSAASSYMSGYRSDIKFTVEYALPVYLGDFNISSAFYVKRAVLTPHFDITLMPGGNLFSAGISAAVEFGCFFWIGTPISIGVTYSYNGGKSFSGLARAAGDIGRHYIGPVFNISLPQ